MKKSRLQWIDKPPTVEEMIGEAIAAAHSAVTEKLKVSEAEAGKKKGKARRKFRELLETAHFRLCLMAFRRKKGVRKKQRGPFHHPIFFLKAPPWAIPRRAWT